MNDLEKTPSQCRILYLVGQLGPGGLERQLFYLLQTLDRPLYRPIVVVWNYQEDDIYVSLIRDLGIQVLAIPKTSGGVLKLFAFRKLVKQLQPEVIHSYCFYTNFAAYFGRAFMRIVAVGAIRSNFTSEKKNSGRVLGRLSARWPNAHISNNTMAAENIKNTRSIFVPRRLFVIRNGLDLQQFRYILLPKIQNSKILAVGSLLSVKRWDRLIEAAADLKQDGYDFLVQIVGDGPLRLSLEKQVENLGLAERVTFLGHRNDIPNLLADSCFLAHTSDSEGCPNVVLEAMACGRAVVATDVGDIPFLIEDGKTGFLVSREDHVTLTQKMAVLLKDIDLCRRMGEVGRSRVEKEFGMDRVVSETLDVYSSAGWKDR